MAETFQCQLQWVGATGQPLKNTNFSRDLTANFPNLPSMDLSAAAAYKGDANKLNPELLFVASLSSCQELTYLYLAGQAGVGVVGYSDDAEGKLGIAEGKMRMVTVTLRPLILLAAGADEQKALALVEKAHHGCFIANSVSTIVRIEPKFEVER